MEENGSVLASSNNLSVLQTWHPAVHCMLLPLKIINIFKEDKKSIQLIAYGIVVMVRFEPCMNWIDT